MTTTDHRLLVFYAVAMTLFAIGFAIVWHNRLSEVTEIQKQAIERGYAHYDKNRQWKWDD